MSDDRSQKYFCRFPAAIAAVAFSIGIICQSWISFDISILISLIACLVIAAYFFRNSTPASLLILASFVTLGGLCLSIEYANVKGDRLRTMIDSGAIPSGAPVEIVGTLVTPAEPMSEGLTGKLSVDRISYRGETISASGIVRFFSWIPDDETRDDYYQLDLHYGSKVSVACNIFREEEFQNPGVMSRVELLDRQGIDATTSIKSPLLIEKLDEAATGPLAFIYDARGWLLREIHEKFSPSTAGVLSASTLGDKYFLDKPTADTFREGGTFHVLVISGLHITFIGGILLLLIRGFTRNRWFQFLIVTAGLWTYTFAVGAEVPVVRASLMFSVMLLGYAIYRQSNLINSLGAAVMILLVWRPSNVFDPSYQLTVVSVASLVVITFPLIEKLRATGKWLPTAATPFPPNVPSRLRKFCETLYWKPAAWSIETSRQIWSARIFKSPYWPAVAARSGQKALSYLFEGVLVSLIVQLWLLPLLVLYFHRVTPVSIVMNLWTGVILAVESFASIAGVMLSQFSSFLALPFIALTEFCNWLLVSAPSVLVGNELASWRIPNYAGWMSIIYGFYFVPMILLSAFLWRWDPFQLSDRKLQIGKVVLKTKTATATTMALATLAVAVIIAHPFSAPRADGRLHIDFLDVGQGDSALVTFPDGTTLLVDGGGRPDYRNSDNDDSSYEFKPDTPGIGESVVSPVLWQKGYSRIDYILATHADADHIQGLADVASNFSVGKALFGRMPANNSEFTKLAVVLDQRGVPAELVSRGETFSLGGALVEVLYPRKDMSPDAPYDNDHSIVLRLSYGNRCLLLAGDVEHGAEAELVNGGGIFKADLVKVPHHGSRTSSTTEFIRAVAPRYAVISVGRHSRFGHPDKNAVERWLASGARVMITGQTGMISVSTDGHDLTVDQFTKPENQH